MSVYELMLQRDRLRDTIVPEPRKPWNEAYRKEAEAIVAALHSECGRHWVAYEYISGRRKSHNDVAIAMRALMIARGEHELENTLYDKIARNRGRW